MAPPVILVCIAVGGLDFASARFFVTASCCVCVLQPSFKYVVKCGTIVWTCDGGRVVLLLLFAGIFTFCINSFIKALVCTVPLC